MFLMSISLETIRRHILRHYCDTPTLYEVGVVISLVVCDNPSKSLTCLSYLYLWYIYIITPNVSGYNYKHLAVLNR